MEVIGTAIPQIILQRKYWWGFFNDRVSGVPKAAKITRIMQVLS